MFKWQFFVLIMWVLCAASVHAEESLTDFFTFLPLDAQTKTWLANQQEQDDHRLIKEIPLALLREQQPYTQCKRQEIDTIQMISIEGPHGSIPIRLYTPKTDTSSLPVLLYFHGGGWALGNLDAYDTICQLLESKAQCLVVSIDYHLAPEYPFPAPLQDCYEGVKWASNNIAKYKGDPSRLAVGGDSAGGNLAAAVTLMARDLNEVKLMYQVLIYPALSYQFDTLSYELFKEDYFLTREDMKCFWEYYVKDQDRKNPYISPLRAQSLSNLPPALLIVADYDVLRDEALAYGWRFQKEGVPLNLKKYGSIHGFMGFDSIDLGKQAIEEIGDSLKKALHAVPASKHIDGTL